ncbi:cation diffusion facilitator family transporter [Caldibacillus debilis]|uniref:cation diffusion facilitator family transporter n=1 Tax=Caldibacillus debilis TaxID=301148 RepID=UPI00058FB8DC
MKGAILLADRRHHHPDDHHHGHPHHHFDHYREGNKKGLMIAVCITAGIMLLEFFGGILTNSLALLSDSGHMLSDLGSLLLSFIAILFAKRPSSPEKTYGYYRFEILAAFVNGITLFFLSGFIVWEAVERFFDPPAVNSGAMIAIAFAGLTANLLSALVLMKTADVQGNINIRSAFLHVVGDALGSVGAIVAGFLMYSFGWYLADPAISVFVALLIMRSGWNVFNRSVHILMEGTPANIDQREVKRALEEIDGVIRVCDLHIWTITSGMDSLSCHLLVDKDCDCQKILQKAIHLMEEKFHIRHSTIQVEKPDIAHLKMGI